jgi:DNA-directed RNA polymerase subunit RPC12/RpoP/membrane protein YdbS with pleckstrin-like domain
MLTSYQPSQVKIENSMITEIKCLHCGGIFEDEILEKNALCPHCGKVTPVMPATPAAKPTPAIQFSPSGFIHKNLMPGEVVTGTAVLHWVIYLQIVYAAIIGLILVCFFYSDFSGAVFSWGAFIVFLILVEIVPVGAAALVACLNMKTAEFAVTNKRVLMKCGFINRRSVEIMLTKIESITVNQGILGRILDFGTIIVGGTGGTKDPFHNIAAPLEFRQKIQMEIEKISATIR